eukprot:Plantae.Rhodophyta-Hildenbrandia_rubra.ctg8410.p1 GENE.Plantae.Rhodophyta-Hildenbrandia_rubra.ctg8410~~Plantae.Rhodophyta-Hildenbrandia_rubra.ctg8410.p1  ORF type:complete len:305 (+),score=53.40 Plantae.Rhodophyta-Hildenbrandia_rubra.ctg8410:85-999(+)
MSLQVTKRWHVGRHIEAVVSAGGGNAVAASSQLTGSVWDGRVHGLVGAGKIEADIAVDVSVADLCCLDEGQFVAACDDGSVKVVHSGGVFNLPGGHHDTAMSVAVSKEKGMVASGGCDRSVLCWNLKDPTSQPFKFEGHIDSVNSIDWTKEGDNLLSASSDGMVCVWDDRQKHWQAAVTIPTGVVIYAARFVGDEKMIVTSNENLELAAYDVRNIQAASTPLWRQGGYKGKITSLRTYPHNPDIVAVASDCPAVTLVSTKNGSTLVKSYQHTDYVRSVAWDDQDPDRLFSGSWDKSVFEYKVSV